MEEGTLIPSDSLFWDQFYGPQGEGHNEFEWYLPFEPLRQVLSKALDKEKLVLQVGCGTSTLAQDIIESSLARHVVSIDSCVSAIDQLLRLNKASKQAVVTRKGKRGKRGGYKRTQQASQNNDRTMITLSEQKYIDTKTSPTSFLVMDACAMDFSPCTFDAVVDKGTLDAMLSIEDEEKSLCWKMMEEIYRVLRDDGQYIVVSGHPKDWVESIFLKSGLWSIDDKGGVGGGHTLIKSPLRRLQPEAKTDASRVCQPVSDDKYCITVSVWVLKKKKKQ